MFNKVKAHYTRNANGRYNVVQITADDHTIIAGIDFDINDCYTIAGLLIEIDEIITDCFNSDYNDLEVKRI